MKAQVYSKFMNYKWEYLITLSLDCFLFIIQLKINEKELSLNSLQTYFPSSQVYFVKYVCLWHTLIINYYSYFYSLPVPTLFYLCVTQPATPSVPPRFLTSGNWDVTSLCALDEKAAKMYVRGWVCASESPFRHSSQDWTNDGGKDRSVAASLKYSSSFLGYGQNPTEGFWKNKQLNIER